MATNKHTFSFQVSTAKTRTVVKVNGIMVATTITVETLVPGTVTKSALIDFVNTHAKKAYPDNPEDNEWEVEVPGLGDVNWEDSDKELTIQGLYSEVAQRLNDNGISVSDWSPYCLNDDSE